MKLQKREIKAVSYKPSKELVANITFPQTISMGKEKLRAIEQSLMHPVYRLYAKFIIKITAKIKIMVSRQIDYLDIMANKIRQ